MGRAISAGGWRHGLTVQTSRLKTGAANRGVTVILRDPDQRWSFGVVSDSFSCPRCFRVLNGIGDFR